MRGKRIVYPMDNVCVEIEFNNGRLSIIGMAPHSSGQIVKDLRQSARSLPERINTDEGWTPQMVETLCSIWMRWHLNDMRAGTLEQERALRAKYGEKQYTYEEACDFLKNIGLYDDHGDRYGMAWYFEEVPEDVLKWLFALPGAGFSFEGIDHVSAEIPEKAFEAMVQPGQLF